jgi:hypothetical protein
MKHPESMVHAYLNQKGIDYALADVPYGKLTSKQWKRFSKKESKWYRSIKY